MASVWKRGRYFYVSYFDRTGKRITTSSHMTRQRDAETLAAGLESKEILARRLGEPPETETEQSARAQTLQELAKVWHGSVLSRGNTQRHANEQRAQVIRLMQIAGVTYAHELTAHVISVALAKLRRPSSEQKSAAGRGLTTLNNYRRAAKGFSRWLWKHGYTRTDQLLNLEGFRASADRRRSRRAMTINEIIRLLRTADRGEIVQGVSGRDRGMMYRLMLGTGLRLGEVQSLKPTSFLWDLVPAIIVVAAGYSKNRREDRQPMRIELAKKLKRWVRSLLIAPDAFIFNLPDKPNQLLQHDLAAAKPPIPERDAHGHVIDLHALRHTFITECARHFSPAITQQLARHADISTTMKYYVHLEAQEIGNALEKSEFMGQKGKQEKPPPAPAAAPEQKKQAG